MSAGKILVVDDEPQIRRVMRVILAGGPSESERRMGAAIEQSCRATLINQIGKDTLPQLLALLARARVLLTPDAGPAHMATMVGTPVVGLYAATNPARSGPYLSRHWCIDAYRQAARAFRGCEPEELPWTHKIEEPGVMDLIGVSNRGGQWAAGGVASFGSINGLGINTFQAGPALAFVTRTGRWQFGYETTMNGAF